MSSKLDKSRSFGKSEKLKSKKIIQKVFSEGQAIKFYPVLCRYLIDDPMLVHDMQATVTVSKRKFRKAVDRNHIKRQLRESYRLSKAGLQSTVAHTDHKIAMVLVYMANKSMPYSDIARAMDRVFTRLTEQINTNDSPHQ